MMVGSGGASRVRRVQLRPFSVVPDGAQGALDGPARLTLKAVPGVQAILEGGAVLKVPRHILEEGGGRRV